MKSKSLYPREKYLNIIRPFFHDTEMIKVITGVRRCGKSSLMQMVQNELLQSGVEEFSILYLNLDKRPYKGLRKPSELESVIDNAFSGKEGIKYLFIDEVQNIKGFEETLNAYREEGDYSIFITGSNSYLLSGELVTKLTGRYLEVEMTTLTFDEYLGMKAFLGKMVKENVVDELRSYIEEGGFPYALNYDRLEDKRTYVQNVVKEIFDKDIKKNKKIRKKRLFNLVMQFVINNFGCTISIDNIVNYLEEVLKENVRKGQFIIISRNWRILRLSQNVQGLTLKARSL